MRGDLAAALAARHNVPPHLHTAGCSASQRRLQFRDRRVLWIRCEWVRLSINLSTLLGNVQYPSLACTLGVCSTPPPRQRPHQETRCGKACINQPEVVAVGDLAHDLAGLQHKVLPRKHLQGRAAVECRAG